MLFPILGETNRTVFMVVMLALVVLALTCTTKVYGKGPLAVILAAWCISAISMQLVARTIEGRWMLPPSTQYVSFFWGDLICLPGIALMTALKLENLPMSGNWWQSAGWTTACFVLALIFALLFRLNDASNYSTLEFNSPVKLWHDLFVYPVFTFSLLRNAPALLAGNWQPYLTLVAVVLFLAWAGMGIYDSSHPKPQAHVAFHW